MEKQLDRVDFKCLFSVIVERRYWLLAACLIYVSLINLISQTIPVQKRLEISFQSATPTWSNQRAYDIALLYEPFLNILASINETNGTITFVKSRASIYLDADNFSSIQLENLRKEIDNFAIQTLKEELLIYESSLEQLAVKQKQGTLEATGSLRSLQLSVLPLYKVTKPLFTSFRWIKPDVNRYVIVNGIALASFTIFTLVFAYFVSLLSLIKRSEK